MKSSFEAPDISFSSTPLQEPGKCWVSAQREQLPVLAEALKDAVTLKMSISAKCRGFHLVSTLTAPPWDKNFLGCKALWALTQTPSAKSPGTFSCPIRGWEGKQERGLCVNKGQAADTTCHPQNSLGSSQEPDRSNICMGDIRRKSITQQKTLKGTSTTAT